jgi:hypothetical protein
MTQSFFGVPFCSFSSSKWKFVAGKVCRRNFNAKNEKKSLFKTLPARILNIKFGQLVFGEIGGK